jgi:hypothetical protein
MLRFRTVLTAALALTLLPACPPGDDDDSDRVIEPAEGCSYPALENVSYEFLIHWYEEDYPQDRLIELIGDGAFSFQFLPAVVTELGPAPDRPGMMAITLTDATEPPEGEDPPEDPNYVRIIYQLPLGYELPAAQGDRMAAWVILDMTGGELINSFSLWEEVEEGVFTMSFLAEPSDAGMAFAPGPNHPVFERVAPRDRQCPNLTAFPCASPYNLSLQFEVRPAVDDEGNETPGDAFELWPTEHRDFVFQELELRVVNVWSFAWREVNDDCTNPYDYSRERLSYFVTRTSHAPPE